MKDSQAINSNKLNDALMQTEESIVYWLKYHAEHTPDKIAIRLVTDSEEKLVTYSEFVNRIKAVAAHLVKNTNKGDRVLLLFDNDDHYATAFYACLFAGLIAVPVFPPTSMQAKNMLRLQNIITDAKPLISLTVSPIKQMIVNSDYKAFSSLCIAIDTLDLTEADNWHSLDRGLEDTALLQYTSGSTGNPKGVIVTHKNLIANQKAIMSHMKSTNQEDDSVISWLPLYHDMGLIGGLIATLFRGMSLILMSPFLFLRQPSIWLKLISKYKPTMSAAPDFAYRLCIERIDDDVLDTLDLSSIKFMLSGAEPIHEETLAAFSERFARCGFHSKAFSPSYGLAEATLLVTATNMAADRVSNSFDRDALEKDMAKLIHQDTAQSNPKKLVNLVSSGQVAPNHQILIADPQSHQPIAHGNVGEILVFGDSVTQGYWDNPEKTKALFTTVNDKQWLRTGDLGFVLDDNLYITGRMKDLIILNGRNIYPQDIEKALESNLEVITKGRTVAFAVTDPKTKQEGVGVAVEIPKSLVKLINMQGVIDEIQAVVSDLCQQPANVVLLLESKSILKTSSGKLQRHACAQSWRDGKLKAYATYEFGELNIHSFDEDSKKKR